MLTVDQPWAWAISTGIKPIESRQWVDGTLWTGSILIHSTLKRFDIAGADWLLNQGYDLPRNLAQGVIVGRVELTYCVADAVARSVFSADHTMWLKPEHPYHLVLSHPEVAEHPIRVPGAQNHGLVPAPRGWREAFPPMAASA